MTEDEIISLIVFLLSALGLMLFIVVYFVFSSRLVGYAVGKVIWYWMLRQNNEYLFIGSLSFAPLGGKVLFRNIKYITKNGALNIIEGYIEIYWWQIIRRNWLKTGKEARMRCYLNGVEWLIYNNSNRYDQINASKKYSTIGDNGEEENLQYSDRIDSSENDTQNIKDILEEDKIQRFFHWAKSIGFEIRRGCIGIGNSELPVSLRVAFRRCMGTITLDKPNISLDKYKFGCDLNFEYIKILFVENNNLRIIQKQHFENIKSEEDIYREAQRQFKAIFKNANFEFLNDLKVILEKDENLTFNQSNNMTSQQRQVFNLKDNIRQTKDIDETKIFLCTKCRVHYYFEEGGIIPEELPTEELPSPEHGVELHFDRFVDNSIIYGPYADHQRTILQNFFFPPLYENSKTIKKVPGRQRKSEKFDVAFYFNEKVTWYFPFIRTPKTMREKQENKGDKEVFTLGFEKNSFLHWCGDLFASNETNDIVTNIYFSLPGVAMRSSNTQAIFAEGEIGKGHFILRNSSEWNGKRDWTFNFEANKSVVFYTADHIGFIMDLIRDWRNYPNQKPPNIVDFFPSIYRYNFKVYNSSLKMHVNEFNIVEYPNDLTKNHFFCITYPIMEISFESPTEIFGQYYTEYKFDVDVKGDKETEPGVHMEYPENHPILENSKEPERKFLWGERAHVHGSYSVHDKINIENVDSCVIHVDLYNVNLMINGYYLNYIITMWFNHFTAERFWMTRKEFESNGFKNDKARQMALLQSSDINSIPYPSNPTEYFVDINIKRGMVHLPHGIYSCEECTKIMGEEFKMDIRYIPTSIDLCFNLGTMMAEIPTVFDEKVKGSKKFIGCEGLRFLSQLPIGPNPEGMLWRRKLHFDVGKLSGEITPSQIGSLVNIGLNFIYQWKIAFYPRPSYAYRKAQYPTRKYSPEMFDRFVVYDVRVSFDGVEGAIVTPSGLINFSVDKGMEITFDTMNNGATNSRFNFMLPTVHVKVMNSREVGMKVGSGAYVQIGELLTGVKVSVEKKSFDVQEHFLEQQKFMHDMNSENNFCLSFDKRSTSNLMSHKTHRKGSDSNTRTQSKKLTQRMGSKKTMTTDISSSELTESDTDDFFDVIEFEDELNVGKRQNPTFIPTPRANVEKLNVSMTDAGKELSVEYINNIIFDDNSLISEDKEKLDNRTDVYRPNVPLKAYSAYLKSYDYELDKEGVFPTLQEASTFYNEPYPIPKIGMHSPFPEFKFTKRNNDDHKDFPLIYSKYARLNMNEYKEERFSFISKKERENILRMMQIEDQYGEKQKTDTIHINIDFTRNIDILFSPNVISVFQQLIKYIVIPDITLQNTADHIEKMRNIFKQTIPEDIIPEKPKPQWDLKKIIISSGIKSINVNCLQSLNVPNIIEESPLQGKEATYSIKAFANNIVGAAAIFFTFNEKKQENELYSIEGFGKCLELGGIAQCLDISTSVYRGIDLSDLPVHFVQNANLKQGCPVVGAITLDKLTFQGKNNIKEENSQGRFTCTIGNNQIPTSGISCFVTHDIIIVGFSFVHAWQKLITEAVLNVKNYIRLRHVYDLLLLSRVSRDHIHQQDVNMPFHGVLEKKQAIKYLRRAVYKLSPNEHRQIQRYLASHIHIKVDNKKEIRDVSNEYSELLEEEEVKNNNNDKQSMSNLLKIRTDLSLHLQTIKLSILSTDYKVKKSTKSIARIDDIFLRGKVEHYVKAKLFDTEYNFDDSKKKKVREISLILSVNCGDISVDIHSQTLLILTSCIGVFLIMKNKHLKKQMEEKEEKKKEFLQKKPNVHVRPVTISELPTHENLIDLPEETPLITTDVINSPIAESEHSEISEKQLPVQKDEIILKLNVFTNVNVQSAAARAWMDKNAFAELTFDKFAFSFNQPQNTEEQTLTLPESKNEKPTQYNLKMKHSGNISVEKILLQFNYASPECKEKGSKEFVSLFDSSVNDLRLNEFMFTSAEEDNVHVYFTFEKLLINFPFADAYYSASVQFRLFVKTWYEAILRKPNIPASFTTRSSPVSIISSPRSTQEETKKEFPFKIPIIKVNLDLNNISAYFNLINSIQMRYNMSKLTFNFHQLSNFDNTFSAHLYPNSFALKTGTIDDFPETNQWIGPKNLGVGATPTDFRKQFLLPEVIISGSLKKQQMKNKTARVLQTLIAIDYIENVVTSELLNHVIAIQSSITEEIVKIVESLSKNVGEEDIEKIKTELPKAKKGVSSLNLFIDIDLILDGIRITALGPSTAVMIDSGKINLNVNTLSKIEDENEGMKIKASVKGINISMIDIHHIKWSNIRNLSDKYSDISQCFPWFKFQTNIGVQNYLDNSLNSNIKEKDNTKNFTLEINDTYIYVRPGAIEQAIFLYKDYKQAVMTLLDRVKKNRNQFKHSAVASLLKTGEQYYSKYSKQVKEVVTKDSTSIATLINSGVVKITNTCVTVPFGDNPYFGFLSNSDPTFKPTACLQVIITAIGLTTMSEHDVSSTLDTLYSKNESTPSQRVGTCKVRSINVYIDEHPHKKNKLLFGQPTLENFENARSKAKVERIIMSLKLNISSSEINTSGVINIPPPDVSINPSIIRRLLDLGNDFFNPKRKFFSDAPSTKKDESSPKTNTSTAGPVKRKIHILLNIEIKPGRFILYNNLNSNDTLSKRKGIDSSSIAVEGRLPSFSVTALHKYPGLNANRSNTHVQVAVDWEGAKLLPKSLYFIMETFYEFKVWRNEQKEIKKKQSLKKKYNIPSSPEDNPLVLKPLAWMKMLKSVLLIQKVFRGFKARKLCKVLRTNKSERDAYLKRKPKKDKKKENVTLQSDTFSLLCRITPFKIILACDPFSDTLTSLEFDDPSDILISRTLRSVQIGNVKGTAMYLNVYTSFPSVLIRCYHPLSPNLFAKFLIKGINGNIGSGYGNYLRPDEVPVYSGTMHVKHVAVEVGLPQMNQFFIMYTLWMDKLEEARKLLRKLRGDIKEQEEEEIIVLYTPEEHEEKEQRKKRLRLEEISTDSTSSKFGQFLISTFEMVCDLGPTIGKQYVKVSSLSAYIKDRGRIENEIKREPLHIGGYIGSVEARCIGRLQGQLLMSGLTIGLNREFKVGGTNAIFKGISELYFKILPIKVELEFNGNKILFVQLKTLSINFIDKLDTLDGKSYHVETSVDSQGAIIRLSKGTASSFINIFFKIKELAEEKKHAALESLQGNDTFFFDRSENINEDTPIYDQIKSFKIKSPTKQFLSMIPVGDVVFKGVELNVGLYEKFIIEDEQTIAIGDWLSFTMNNYQLKFKRTVNLEDKIVERNLSLFLANISLDRMVNNKQSFILGVPGCHLVMNSLQKRSEEDIINYTFNTKFPKSITVTTNLNEYTFLRGIVKLYKTEVTNEIEENKKKNRSMLGSTTATTLKLMEKTEILEKKESNIFGIPKRKFIGTVELNPKLNVLGELTPSVTTVLQWLGINDKNVIPKKTHEFVTDALESLTITCYRVSEVLDKTLDETNLLNQ
ncbi:hypothetical protein ABK040_006087 [Willaertia magna]